MELSTQGWRSVITVADRPHLSLTVGSGFEYVDFSHLNTDLPPLPEVTFSAAATFPGPDGVVFAAPLPSHELLNLHATLFRYLHGIPVEHDPYYLPGNWMPHATIGLDIPRHEVGAAIDLVVKHLPLIGRIERIELVHIPTGESRLIAGV